MRSVSFIFLFVLGLSSVLNAEPIKVPIQDGFLATCKSVEELGERVFRMNMTNESSLQFKLQIKTFVCAQSNDKKIELIPLSLSTPTRARNTTLPLTFEIIKPFVLVLNTENTQILSKVKLDEDLSSQVVFIDKNLITEDVIDLTIIGIGVTKADQVIVDEVPIRGGHFRFSNLD